MLAGLIGDLGDSPPDDAYTGASKLDAVLEVMARSLRPVVNAFGEQLVRHAIESLSDRQDRILIDLRPAAELAARREQLAGDEGPSN